MKVTFIETFRYSQWKTCNMDCINYIATSRVRFRLYLGNWMTDHYGICSVARSKAVIRVNSIFSEHGMCRVFAQQVICFAVSIDTHRLS